MANKYKKKRYRNEDTVDPRRNVEASIEDEAASNNFNSYKYRNIDHKLYTPLPTLKCAKINFCIPCSYKIAAFDIALDTSFTKSVPNTRPELCPRTSISASTSTSTATSTAAIENVNKSDSSETNCSNETDTCGAYSYGYEPGMNILTVGDGDFSFSLALARSLKKNMRSSKNEDSQCSSQLRSQVIATSYESYETLRKVYPQIQNTLDELKRLDVKVLYEVDATNLVTTLRPQLRLLGGDSDMSTNTKFNRIIWNFPCTAIANGQDGQNQQMKDNQMLVRTFVKQCVAYLDPRYGEIQFLHKSKPPYDQWGLQSVAVEDAEVDVDEKIDEMIDEQKDDNHNDHPRKTRLWSETQPCPFEYKGRVVFDKCLLPPYTPRKALDKKSFPCHDACLYVFGWKTQKHKDDQNNNSNKKKKKKHKKNGTHCADAFHYSFPETITTTTTRASEDGNNDTNIGRDSESESGVAIVPVTTQMIDELRSLHLSLGSHKERKKRKLRRE